MIIYLGCSLPSTSCGSLSRALGSHNVSSEPSTARPCTRVRILPFHPTGYPASYSRRNSFAFARDVSARTSHLTVDGCYPLPGSAFTRACSDFPLHPYRQSDHHTFILYHNSVVVAKLDFFYVWHYTHTSFTNLWSEDKARSIRRTHCPHDLSG
jgi:hypothetical protein